VVVSAGRTRWTEGQDAQNLSACLSLPKGQRPNPIFHSAGNRAPKVD
jgi:hypothetical protein